MQKNIVKIRQTCARPPPPEYSLIYTICKPSLQSVSCSTLRVNLLRLAPAPRPFLTLAPLTRNNPHVNNRSAPKKVPERSEINEFGFGEGEGRVIIIVGLRLSFKCQDNAPGSCRYPRRMQPWCSGCQRDMRGLFSHLF